MNSYLQLIIGIARTFIPLAGDQVHKTVERAVTIPRSQRNRLYGNMSPEDVAHAEELHSRMTDAIADYSVFVASRGEIEED